MPSKPKTYPYAIYRTDNTYLVYDLTKADYQKILQGCTEGKQFVEISIGILNLTDIRAVIEQKPPKKVKEKPALPPMSPEERAWLMQHMAEMGYSLNDDDEGVDY